MNKFIKLGIILGIAGILFGTALSYAQSIGTSTTTTIGYFYSASGTMVDAENSTGVMSSYLTRGIRYNGTGETFTVSNIKDVTGLVDADGNVLNKYTYTAYGVPTSYSSTSINSNLNTQNSTLSISSNPYTYSNYYTDSESGNYYLNARYYDPTIGIFLTSDTYNLPNRNMYVSGNPIMGVDQTGHNFEEIIKGIVKSNKAKSFEWSTLRSDSADNFKIIQHKKGDYTANEDQKSAVWLAAYHLYNLAKDDENQITSIELRQNTEDKDNDDLGSGFYYSANVSDAKLNLEYHYRIEFSPDNGGTLRLKIFSDELNLDESKGFLDNYEPESSEIGKIDNKRLFTKILRENIGQISIVPRYDNDFDSNQQEAPLECMKAANSFTFLSKLVPANIDEISLNIGNSESNVSHKSNILNNKNIFIDTNYIKK